MSYAWTSTTSDRCSGSAVKWPRRYRLTWTGKLVLQVRAEEFRFLRGWRTNWRDATVEDLTEHEALA